MDVKSARIVVPALCAAAVVAADVATKALARGELAAGRSVELPFGTRLQVGENRGVAFGLLAGGGDIILVFVLIAVAGVAVMWLRSASATGTLLPAGLVLGGALANLADRLGDGGVTDFIDLDPWPSFNLADIAITLGVSLLALSYLRGQTSHSPPGNRPHVIGDNGADSKISRR